MNPKILEALAVTCAVTQTDMPEAAARVIATDLDTYPESAVMAALVRCRRELTGRLTLAAVLERLDDGRPGPEEAWAASPRNENDAIVWTPEWSEAFFTALPHLEAGDAIAARMTFLETYRKRLAEARSERAQPQWSLSRGWNHDANVLAVTEAVGRGRISVNQAVRMLPNLPEEALARLTTTTSQPALEQRP